MENSRSRPAIAIAALIASGRDEKGNAAHAEGLLDRGPHRRRPRYGDACPACVAFTPRYSATKMMLNRSNDSACDQNSHAISRPLTRCGPFVACRADEPPSGVPGIGHGGVGGPRKARADMFLHTTAARTPVSGGLAVHVTDDQLPPAMQR